MQYSSSRTTPTVIGAKYNSSVYITGDPSIGTHLLSTNLPSPISLTLKLEHKFNGVSQPLLSGPLREFDGVRGRGNRAFAAAVYPRNVIGESVFVKWAKGKSEVDLLQHEATLYAGKLKPLWGIAVPKFFGLFKGPQENAPVACMLLELCLGASSSQWKDISLKEFNRLAYDSLQEIHRVGVEHRSLLADVLGCPRAHVGLFPDNPRIQRQHFLLWNGRILFVDFSYARSQHSCPRLSSMLPSGEVLHNCQEFNLLHWLHMTDPKPCQKRDRELVSCPEYY